MNAQVDVLAVMAVLDETIRVAKADAQARGSYGAAKAAVVFEEVRAAVAALIAERDALAQDVERLRRDCAEAYQVVGAGMLGEPCSYAQGDVERALDNLSAAANGEPRPHDDLLPWPSALVIRRPIGESA